MGWRIFQSFWYLKIMSEECFQEDWSIIYLPTSYQVQVCIGYGKREVALDFESRFCTNTISSISFICSVVSNSSWFHEPQHARLPCPSPTPRVHSNPCPLSRWCHQNISSSDVPFSSCPQSFLASGSFPKSQRFASGGQSIEVSASKSVVPMNTQDWSPLGWTGWISLQSKGLSRVFSNTTVQKHEFFSTQLSLWSNSHIHTWLLEKP